MKKTDNKTMKKTGLGAKASRRIGNAVTYIILILISIFNIFTLIFYYFLEKITQNLTF